MGATSVSGRLPPEVIQRIVRQNFGRFRLCYENGLRNNPNLQGRVAVRFVIGREGDVIAASSRFGALDITPQTARMLINSSYQIQEYQIIRGPDWLRMDRYDVDAIVELSPLPPLPLNWPREFPPEPPTPAAPPLPPPF